MSPRSSSGFSSSQRAKGRVATFWQRVTDGFELHQLWRQFKSEAKASYRLYSADVDWHDIEGKSHGKISRYFRSVWALFLAMLMKLSPARRVLLLAAIVLLLFQPSLRFGRTRQAEIHLEGAGVVILFVLLAIELADRVTMKRDLEIAREIQEWLVPEHPPEVPGLDIAFAAKPQNTVAGDYFDAFVRPPTGDSGAQHLLVAVADVAGKSIPAALLMATFQASLHTLMATSATLDEIVANLDQYCRAHSLDGRRFTTAFLAELEIGTCEMVYVNAGHNPPILRRSSGEVERLDSGGPPFGIPVPLVENGVRYRSGRLQLHPGDLLFIFTDGLIEAVNEADQEYGEDRLLPSLQNRPADTAAEILSRVMTDVNAFIGHARQHDDITALVLCVQLG